MTRYTFEEAKFILGLLSGRETGFTTQTQTRDAARTILDHLAEEPEWEYGVRATGDSEPFTDHYESLNEMSEEFDGRVVWNTDEEIVRRRKAGPWGPLEN